MRAVKSRWKGSATAKSEKGSSYSDSFANSYVILLVLLFYWYLLILEVAVVAVVIVCSSSTSSSSSSSSIIEEYGPSWHGAVSELRA